MTRIAEVFINLPVKNIAKSFSYIVPESLFFVGAGWRVLVPFGGRKAEGFVVSVAEAEAEDLKAIIDAVDSEPWFTGHMLAVAEWLSGYYLCTPAEAMRLFMPGKAGLKIARLYRAVGGEAAVRQLDACSAAQRELYEALLADGPLTLGQITSRYGGGAETLVRRLTARKLLTSESVAKKAAQPRYQTFWQLAVSRETACAAQAELRRKPAQSRLLTALLENEKLTVKDLRRLNISGASLKGLQAAGLIAAGRTRLLRNSYSAAAGDWQSLKLSADQQNALTEIIPAIEGRRYRSFLLFGVTGSGKTQVYIEAAARTLQLGRQVVVLVPEIALTGQIVSRFKERFDAEVAVLHSKLSVGERYDTSRKLRSGEAGIVIGARSAVFAAVPDPGLFIIDEEHEFTYKQEESPHYHTRMVARKRAELAGATVVLGSATPAVETYFDAVRGLHRMLVMPARIDGTPLPEVEIVDMRQELKEGRRSVISGKLRELVAAAVERGEQAIILLNRRGYSTFVICRECGHVMKCAHCAVSLVYHAAGGALRCHYCQGREAVPDVCPACGSRYIRYFGTGTQKVEEELRTIFPQARIVRMDQDTTGGKMAHDRILSSFSAGEYDILLGTQMVAKGHDMKNVTAVGIISADTALNLPDFRAAERTFALLTQAAGRAGRGDRPGRVVVQTYSPEHYAVKAGAEHDYETFFNQEIHFRRELRYPPYSQLIKLTVQGGDEIKTRDKAERLTAALTGKLNGAGDVIGPFSAPVAKISDLHRVHILVKTTDIMAANAAVRALGIDARGDVAVDVDPLNVL